MKPDYNLSTQIYENPDAQVYVYTGTIHQGSESVAIKITLHSTLAEANMVINEAMSQARLSHSNICKVMDCFLEETQDRRMQSVLILELMVRDLAAEIEQRKTTRSYWSEMELVTYLGEMISALFYAQSKGVSHRDIKPQNIFVDSAGNLKLGDFGSCSSTTASVQLTGVQGTPLFLSPELRNWHRENMGNTELIPNIDPYQSDVFSLGITLLYMAKLEPPMELIFSSSVEAGIEQALASVQYPTISGILRWMLASNPSERPTFQVLFDYLAPMLPSIPEYAERQWSLTHPQTTENDPQVPSQSEITFGSHSQIPAPSMQMIPNCSVCGAFFQPNSQWQMRTDGTCICSQDCLKNLQSREIGNSCPKCKGQVQDLSWRESVRSQFGEYSSELSRFCSSSCAAGYFGVQLQRQQPRNACAWCQREIIVTNMLDSPVIQLLCLHIFHDIDCLLAYCKRQSSDFTETVQFLCPQCRNPISEDITERVLQRRDSLLKLEYCENCKSTPMTRSCEKGHRLCTSCSAKKYTLPKLWRKPEHCPICKQKKEAAKAQQGTFLSGF